MSNKNRNQNPDEAPQGEASAKELTETGTGTAAEEKAVSLSKEAAESPADGAETTEEATIIFSSADARHKTEERSAPLPPIDEDDEDDEPFVPDDSTATYEDEEFDEEDVYDYREEHRARRRRRAKARRRHKRVKGFSCAMVLLTLILATGTVLAVSILAVAKEIYGIEKDISKKIIVIEKGSTTQDIAEQLQKEKMISLPQAFRLISRLNGKDGSYIAGEHELSPSMSYESMIAELCKNHEDERQYVTVTFREGISLLDAAEILAENEVCEKDQFLFRFNAGGYGFEFENHLGEATPLKFYRMEGYCFPDTYQFYVNEDPQIVAQKIYANFDSKISAADYRKMDELGMTLDQVITLASIVQAEAPYLEEMRKVASVFHNRLLNTSLFPSLESDPTRKYAENVIRPNNPVQNQVMEDAYNTYVGTGLPPGAIGNPGRDAIQATLYPDDTPYYFFAANVDTREVFYAVTNAEHEANLALIKQQQAEAAAAANN